MSQKSTLANRITDAAAVVMIVLFSALLGSGLVWLIFAIWEDLLRQ